MPTDQGPELVKRRHPEWERFRLHWRWLLDSYEAGVVYRDATYGTDALGMPIRNLVRHKHEYPEPRDKARASELHVMGGVGVGLSKAMSQMTGGEDPAARDAPTSAYEQRRSRTPVPTFVREAAGDHLSQIYAREVARKGPKTVKAWWMDVDGEGTPIDQWMEEKVAPLLLILGRIDILMDNPQPPPGFQVVSDADAEAAGIKKCLASVILPENLVWWRLDPRGTRYVEALVREHHEDEAGCLVEFFRHWTDAGWTIYDKDGVRKDGKAHPFGVVPIVRRFVRKRDRFRNVGISHYESIAEIQKEFYNRDSELILSDTQQAHPLLQGPEDNFGADGSIPIGPQWMLLKKKTQTGTTVGYEGYDYIDPPKGAADSIRQNKGDLRDEADRAAKLTRPAGAKDVAKGTVEQSGISKNLDQKSAHDMLTAIGKVLRACEVDVTRMAMRVLGLGDGTTPRVQIAYPTSFDLYTASDTATSISDFQNLLDKSGNLPEVEGPMLQRYIRLALPDKEDEFYDATDEAVSAFLASGGGIGRKMAAQQALAEQQAATAAKVPGGRKDPAGRVRDKVKNPADRLQPPGQTGRPGTDKKKK